MLSSCGFYHDYGLKIGSSKSVLHQDNEFYITDDYEFVSVLYRSEDGLLTITLQHPLHPVPEPEVFISQLAFQLDDSSKVLEVGSIQLTHSTPSGDAILPLEVIDKLQNGNIDFGYYANKYRDNQLGKVVIESVKVTFTYDGKLETIEFNEKVEFVKRWSKFGVAMSI